MTTQTDGQRTEAEVVTTPHMQRSPFSLITKQRERSLFLQPFGPPFRQGNRRKCTWCSFLVPTERDTHYCGQEGFNRGGQW